MADLGDLPQKEHALEAGPARRVMQAMVDTLLDGAPPELAVRLRQELPDVLKGATKAYNAEAPASLGEMLERFRQRARLPREDVLHEAQIAVGLIRQMLLEETFAGLRASLPDQFAPLFERAPVTR